MIKLKKGSGYLPFFFPNSPQDAGFLSSISRDLCVYDKLNSIVIISEVTGSPLFSTQL